MVFIVESKLARSPNAIQSCKSDCRVECFGIFGWRLSGEEYLEWMAANF